MKRKWFMVCLGFGLLFSSIGFAMDPILVGDFESGPDTGFTPYRYDHWFNGGLAISDTLLPAVAATRGTHSLKCVDADGGWGATVQLPLFDNGNTLDNPWIQAILSPQCVISVDVTAVASEVAGGWCELGFIHNTAAPSGGWNLYMWQPLIVDGLPHRYVFTMDEETRNSIINAIGGWGANIGFGINTATTGSTTIYIDNVWIWPEGLVDEYGPRNPSVEQEFAANPNFVNALLKWRPGGDPNGQYEVNPLIVDEYVFMSKTLNDPNLYYHGRTGVDPGLSTTESQYGPVLLPINSTFRWAVVEAVEGFEQTFTVGVSTLEAVDPNNIVGPIWSFNTLSTLPVITAQPVSTRYVIGGPNPQFTVTVQSVTTPSYQWYFSQDGVIDASDTAISASIGGNSPTLTIPSANKAYQAYYYCRIWNAATQSGGGSFPDVYSNVVTLVVERKVAEYLFDGNLNDSSGHGINGTGVGSPTFAAGIGGGQALSLNGLNQYVTLGNNGFPKASLLDAGGIGGGLDRGSVVCWVKVNSVPGGEPYSKVAAILSGWNHGDGWPHTAFELAVESDLDSTYTNARALVLGETAQVTWVSWRPTWVNNFNMAGDGQWHMIAATWAMDDIMRVYVDGSLIATSGSAVSSTFLPWVNGMLIGASPQDTQGGIHRYFNGLIDNLRVYNYVLTSETIAQEYYNLTGKPGCIYTDFPGSNFNVDNTGTSYCRVDLADFALMAQNWLAEGFYP
ncbi:MAG TPA: hypothetical protein PK054_11670 [Anaerohalosphaeraceae bacterium]|nr:hypothetical protein [Anaerohalosphaeraceae bacterium]HOL89628.1 hypothetical protein [Anaerohalosphaeraceae bacterium]HPP57222.1 hypothetical protein [Anaerohalosphaeraceae bacterium]